MPLNITDLGISQELDTAAARELRGGMNYGFLGGLFAGRPGSQMAPSLVQNIFIDYDETNIEIAPVHFNNIADNGSVAQIGGPVNITNVVGTSQVNLLRGLTGGV